MEFTPEMAPTFPDNFYIGNTLHQTLSIMLQPFFVWRDRTLIRINPENVAWLSTEENYTRIYLPDRTYYMVRSSLSNALKKLPPGMFIKVHRSYAISVYYIDVIERDCLQTGDVQIPIGKQYYKSLISKLNIID